MLKDFKHFPSTYQNFHKTSFYSKKLKILNRNPFHTDYMAPLKIFLAPSRNFHRVQLAPNFRKVFVAPLQGGRWRIQLFGNDTDGIGEAAGKYQIAKLPNLWRLKFLITVWFTPVLQFLLGNCNCSVE